MAIPVQLTAEPYHMVNAAGEAGHDVDSPVHDAGNVRCRWRRSIHRPERRPASSEALSAALLFRAHELVHGAWYTIDCLTLLVAPCRAACHCPQVDWAARRWRVQYVSLSCGIMVIRVYDPHVGQVVQPSHELVPCQRAVVSRGAAAKGGPPCSIAMWGRPVSVDSPLQQAIQEPGVVIEVQLIVPAAMGRVRRLLIRHRHRRQCLFSSFPRQAGGNIAYQRTRTYCCGDHGSG
jgi:hypothetical protein